jgi:membrane fusion protein (multidrug efflux system)
MSDAVAADPQPTPTVKKIWNHDWFFPLLRVLLVVFAAFLAWYVAGHWNRWTGAARHESTDDAYMFGDLTPLSAKVSGYVETVAVGDYQSVRKGDRGADPSTWARGVLTKHVSRNWTTSTFGAPGARC